MCLATEKMWNTATIRAKVEDVKNLANNAKVTIDEAMRLLSIPKDVQEKIKREIPLS